MEHFDSFVWQSAAYQVYKHEQILEVEGKHLQIDGAILGLSQEGSSLRALLRKRKFEDPDDGSWFAGRRQWKENIVPSLLGVSCSPTQPGFKR